MTDKLLEVNQLTTQFFTRAGVITSVNGLSFTVQQGETVAIVGESGSGKSVTSLSIMGLLPPQGRVTNGEILLQGKNLLTMKKAERRKLRGSVMSMIFQEPMTSLNPVFSIGNQLSEVIRLHQNVDRKTARKKSEEMLERVGIANAAKVLEQFPHQLSGGMGQRGMIAIALACRPKLLIADEPTTALDVTIQAQILDLIRQLSKEENTGVILITHDLGVVAEMADRVLVMYAGETVEQAAVDRIFHHPSHPYAKGLLSSLPNMKETKDQLEAIPGTVPNPLHMPTGCAFHPRCSYATEQCSSVHPPMEKVTEQHFSRCWYAKEVSK